MNSDQAGVMNGTAVFSVIIIIIIIIITPGRQECGSKRNREDFEI
jgi:hypothetical protein